jgi:hypothetical protein
MSYHPHVHRIVSRGGLSDEQAERTDTNSGARNEGPDRFAHPLSEISVGQ